MKDDPTRIRLHLLTPTKPRCSSSAHLSVSKGSLPASPLTPGTPSNPGRPLSPFSPGRPGLPKEKTKAQKLCAPALPSFVSHCPEDSQLHYLDGRCSLETPLGLGTLASLGFRHCLSLPSHQGCLGNPRVPGLPVRKKQDVSSKS